MKVNFQRSAFAECLSILASVVPARTPKPILRCVHINAQDSQVEIKATDLEVGINCIVSGVEVKEPGQIVIPADKLCSVVRESAEEVLTMEADDSVCKIIGSDSLFTILCLEPDQYPQIPAGNDQPDMQINVAALQDAVQLCLFATAKESTRYALNGVLWEIKGKKLSLIATDGRRLAKTRVSLVDAPSEKIQAANIIVPSKTLNLLEKVSASEKEIADISIVDNRLVIKCENILITSNLVEGTFPRYEDIIPKDYDKKIKISTTVCSSAVKRSALLTSEESRGIRLAISKNMITFSCRAPETGDAKVDMPVEYAGEPVDIGFNPQFIMDVLRVIPVDEFDLELGQADRPALIKFGKDFQYVLMPINLG